MNEQIVSEEAGQVNVIGVIIVGLSMAAIAGVIGILIFANVYDALNTDLVSASAVNLLDLEDLLLAAGLLLGTLAGIMAIALAFSGVRT